MSPENPPGASGLQTHTAELRGLYLHAEAPGKLKKCLPATMNQSNLSLWELVYVNDHISLEQRLLTWKWHMVLAVILYHLIKATDRKIYS